MILRALMEYYDRIREESANEVPEIGFSTENFSFALILDKEGNLLHVQDIREYDKYTEEEGIKKDKKNRPRKKRLIVPRDPDEGKRTSGIRPHFMWDNTGYVLGAGGTKAEEKFKKFKEFHQEVKKVANVNDEAMDALLKFLDKWKPEQAQELESWDEMKEQNVVFRFANEKEFFHERPAIKEAWKKYLDLTSEKSEYKARCLLTGEMAPIARLHLPVKGLPGVSHGEANLVNFDDEAFCSYGKKQGYNAPISIKAMFKYCTALTHLLSSENRKVQIGDVTITFWADKENPMEDLFSEILRGEDPQTVKKVGDFLKTVKKGKMPVNIEGDTKFYILGLSPNGPRIAVRFCYEGTVEELSKRISKHFKDIEIEKQFEKYDPDHPGIKSLLKQTAFQGKEENIPIPLESDLIQSILTGSNYPNSMLQVLLVRIRKNAPKNEKGEELVKYLQASMIKGILTRNFKKEVPMSLDKNNKEPAYLLGRLFAVLEKAREAAQEAVSEKAQKDINPGTKATILGKYFASASTTPGAIFPILLRLNQYYTSKSEYGNYYRAFVAEIIEDLPSKKFPAHLSLPDQGLFCIGYYHQRNDFFRKKEEKKEGKTN